MAMAMAIVEPEYIKNMDEKSRKKWACRWDVIQGMLEKETPPWYVINAFLTFLDEGILPEDPRLRDMCYRVYIWKRDYAKAETERRNRAAARRSKR